LLRDHVVNVDENNEFDKVVDTLIVDGGEYASKSGAANSVVISYATGVTNLILKNLKAYGWLDLSPRHLIIDNVDVITNAVDSTFGISTEAGWGMDSISVTNTRIWNSGSTALLNAVDAGVSFSDTAGTGSSGQTIDIPWSGNGPLDAQRISYGSIVQDTTSGAYGPVNGIYYSSPNLVITIDNSSGTWGSVSSGDTITWRVPTVTSDGEGNSIEGVPLNNNRTFWRDPALVQ
jgi:hypothetical protein